MELEGRKELFDTGKSSRTYRFSSFGRFEWVPGQKWLFLALNCSF